MRLDPRTKLLILAVTSVSVFMNKSIAVECVLAGIPLVLLSVSGNLKRMLKYAAFFLALLLIQLFRGRVCTTELTPSAGSRHRGYGSALSARGKEPFRSLRIGRKPCRLEDSRALEKNTQRSYF